jgi:ZIP family zinc transporter
VAAELRVVRVSYHIERVTTLEPQSAVFVFSGLAAAAAALGLLPQALGRPPSRAAVGWANALATGLMLGVAYNLLAEGLAGRLILGGLGSILGIGFVRASHTVAGTGELQVDLLEASGADVGRKATLVNALHAADEGIAIGVAVIVSMPLGIAMAGTLAVHNVPEAMVLGTVLTRRGLTVPKAAAVAVAVNVNQVLLAVASFGLLSAIPSLLPLVAGFAVGTLMYRSLVELLPESYRQAGETSIALVTLLAMGAVVLLAGVAR